LKDDQFHDFSPSADAFRLSLLLRNLWPGILPAPSVLNSSILHILIPEATDCPISPNLPQSPSKTIREMKMSLFLLPLRVILSLNLTPSPENIRLMPKPRSPDYLFLSLIRFTFFAG
jgi:hypothetical protein